MTRDDRAAVVFECVDEAITKLRLIRGRVQKNKHIDPSEIMDLQAVIESLRHHCDMHNDERVQ